MPHPLFDPCAAPMVAPRLWPLQSDVVFDITLQPVILAFGAPLVLILWAPLLASANRQNCVGVGPWVATAVAFNDC